MPLTLHPMLTDIKYAFRTLIKTPGFAIIAVLTLALGIGANTAMFSVIDAVLLRPLRFKNPDQLVMVWNILEGASNARATISFPDFYDYRAQSHRFDKMAYYGEADTVLSGAGEAQAVSGVVVGGDFFETLGEPALGRGFTAEEAKAGGPNAVVISHGLWQRAFGADPEILGRQVTMTSRTYTIFGVMPAGWKFPVQAETSDFIMPYEPLIKDVTNRASHELKLIGRLKPGMSVKQAELELKAVAAELERQYPDANAGRTIALVPLLQEIVGDVRPALWVLLSAVIVVLLIACANVANLLLARAAVYSREIAIRLALGATRAAIIRQLLIENLLLALIGGLCGFLLAWGATDLLRTLGPRNVPRLADVHINLSVGAFSFGLAILSTLFFGLVPAMQIFRPNLTETLQQRAKGSSCSLHGSRLRAALVVSQVSLSLLLLAGAGLLMRSFFNLRATNLGFETSRLFMLYQFVPRSYADPQKQRDFYAQVLSKLAALPGIFSVGGATPLPFSDFERTASFRMENEPERGPGTHPNAAYAAITPNYFRTMRIPVRKGRDFDQRDNETAPHVALINETIVRRYVTNGNPVGQRIVLDRASGNPEALEIVGVVGDAKQKTIGVPAPPQIYQPFAQAPNRRLWLVFRTAADNVTDLQASVRRVIQEQDKDVYVGNVEPMQNSVGKTLAEPRFNMVILSIFAMIAMALAAVGIYGVIAYSVAQRTREIGIRMALGAQRGEVLRMILKESLMVALIGIALGLMAAFAATRLLASLLYGVGCNDLFTYVSVILLLTSAALLASYLPARRAMKVDPMIALRTE